MLFGKPRPVSFIGIPDLNDEKHDGGIDSLAVEAVLDRGLED